MDPESDVYDRRNESYCGLSVGSVYFTYSFSFWIVQPRPIATEVVPEWASRHGLDLSDIAESVQARMKGGAPLFTQAGLESRGFTELPVGSMDEFDGLVRNFDRDRIAPWWIRTIQSVSQAPGSVRVASPPGSSPESLEATRFLAYCFASRQVELYFRKVSQSIHRLLFPPLTARVITGKGSGLFGGESTDLLMYPSVTFWEAATTSPDWTRRLVTVSLIFSVPRGPTVDTRIGCEKIGRFFECLVVDSKLETSGCGYLGIKAGYRGTESRYSAFQDMLADICQTVSNSFGTSGGWIPSEDAGGAEKGVRNRMACLVLGRLRVGPNPVNVPDYTTGESDILAASPPGLAHLIGRLTWALRHDYIQERKVEEKSDIEVVADIRKNQIGYWRADFTNFVNRYGRLMISLVNFEDGFPRTSYGWTLASASLAAENLSAQYATVNEYNTYIEGRESGGNVREMLEIRRQQVADLEQFYNVETTDQHFASTISALQFALGIQSRFDVVKQKLEALSSRLLVLEQQDSSHQLEILTQAIIPLTLAVGLGSAALYVYTAEGNVLALGFAAVMFAAALTITFYSMSRHSTRRDRG